MRRNQIKGIAGLITALCLTANIWMFPACAEEAQTETPEEATEQMHQWKSGSELEDGILTIRIEAEGNTDPDFWWQNSTADKGDASFVEPAGQKEEEGLAFCGSYRAIEEDWEGEDTIRLVYTNGHYTAEYM